MALVGLGVYRRHRRLQGRRGRAAAAEARARRPGGDDADGPAVRRAAHLRGDHAPPRHHVSVRARHERRHRAHRARVDASICCSSRPATANIIGKFANGIADDFLSALYLADERARAGRAGDEHEHVGARRPCARTSTRLGRSRRALRRSGRGLSGLRLGRQGPAGGARGDRRGRRGGPAAPKATAARARACSSPPGRRSKISIRCGSSAIDRAAGWGLRVAAEAQRARRGRDARRRPDGVRAAGRSRRSCACEARARCTRR